MCGTTDVQTASKYPPHPLIANNWCNNETKSPAEQGKYSD